MEYCQQTSPSESEASPSLSTQGKEGPAVVAVLVVLVVLMVLVVGMLVVLVDAPAQVPQFAPWQMSLSTAHHAPAGSSSGLQHHSVHGSAPERVHVLVQGQPDVVSWRRSLPPLHAQHIDDAVKVSVSKLPHHSG